MMKLQQGSIQWPQWVLENIKEGSKIGVNCLLMPAGIPLEENT
jgi:hypothetical protein